jgi:hypothetical protein
MSSTLIAAESVAMAPPSGMTVPEVAVSAGWSRVAPADVSGAVSMAGLPEGASTAIAGASAVGLTGSVPCVVCAKTGPARSVRTDAVHSRDDDRMMTSWNLISRGQI